MLFEIEARQADKVLTLWDPAKSTLPVWANLCISMQNAPVSTSEHTLSGKLAYLWHLVAAQGFSFSYSLADWHITAPAFSSTPP
eukprot:379870-Rhodomonas_salina.5